jgi:hypothetical protein
VRKLLVDARQIQVPRQQKQHPRAERRCRLVFATSGCAALICVAQAFAVVVARADGMPSVVVARRCALAARDQLRAPELIADGGWQAMNATCFVWVQVAAQ